MTEFHATPGYEPLSEVLDAAYEQAAEGKGKTRHANGLPFIDQPIMKIGRLVGMGYQTGQAIKKATEAGGMLARGEHGAARAELLGAINYLAAAVLLIEEQSDASLIARVIAASEPTPIVRTCRTCAHIDVMENNPRCLQCSSFDLWEIVRNCDTCKHTDQSIQIDPCKACTFIATPFTLWEAAQ